MAVWRNVSEAAFCLEKWIAKWHEANQIKALLGNIESVALFLHKWMKIYIKNIPYANALLLRNIGGGRVAWLSRREESVLEKLARANYVSKQAKAYNRAGERLRKWEAGKLGPSLRPLIIRMTI